MQYEFIEIDESKETLRFTFNGVEVMNTEKEKREAVATALQINHVGLSIFYGIAKWEKKRKQGVQIFAALLADIDKTLRLKYRLTKEDF